MTWRTIHCSDPDERRDSDDGLRWQDDAPVRAVAFEGRRRLTYEDGRDVEVVRR